MPDNDEYRKEIQDKVQNILSERHEKSTPKLVIEAVVEGVKLYRSFQEDKKRKEEGRGKGKGKSRHRRGVGMDKNRNDRHRRHQNHKHSKRDDGSSERRRHRHHSRSPGRERGRHRDNSTGRHRSLSRHRHGDESRKEKRGRSRSRNKRSRSCQRDRKNNIRDPVTEGGSQDDTQYQMSGGTGPANTVHDGHGDSSAQTRREQQRPTSGASDYQTSWRDLRRQSRSPSRSREHRENTGSGRRAPTPHRSARKSSQDRSRARSRSRQRTRSPDPGRKRAQTPHHSHHRDERSKSRQQWSNKRPGRIGKSRSPTRQQKDPNGTLFGSLPKYKAKVGIALGLGDHFMNTYKHIKAEHDGGHRTRGFIEKALDEARKKRTGAKADQGKQANTQRRDRGGDTRHVQKKQSRDEAQRDRERKRGEGQDPKNLENKAQERLSRDRNERRRSNQESRQKERGETPKPNPNLSTPKIHIQAPTSVESRREEPSQAPRKQQSPEHSSSPPPPAPEYPQWEREQSERATASYEDDASSPREPLVRSEDDKSQSGAATSYYQNASGPPGSGDCKSQVQSRPQSPVGACASEVREATSGASSTIMSHAPPPPPGPRPGPGPGPAPVPPHPPPPPPLGTQPLANSMRAALLVSIQSGKKLRSVAPTHQEDEHANPKAEKVHYEETTHSHEVEEHERAQAKENEEKAKAHPEPNRAFRDSLLSALEGRNAGLGSRTSMITNVASRLQEKDATVQQFSRSESGDDLVFTLAAHVARPGWSFDGIENGQ